MTSRELQVLKAIYQLGGQASLGAISKKNGLSLDYSRGLAKVLLRQHLLDQPANRLFVLTAQGRLLVAESPMKAEEAPIFSLAEAACLVSRQTNLASTLPSESGWFSSRFLEEPVSFTKHGLNKNQTVELEEARSVQAGIDGLISINSPPLAGSRQRRDERSKRKIEIK